MIDIHSHVIYGVDDGPATIEESMALLKEAHAQGVSTIVATSHRRKGMFETPEKVILDHFLQVNSRASQEVPGLTLLYGGELYMTPDILRKLETGDVPTMSGTRFVLIEFSSATPYKDIHQAVSQVSLLGLTPIIAHIERYQALAFDEKKVMDLIAMGAYMQVNSSHVLKPKLIGDSLKPFKKRAKFFLDKNVVHVIASDMHNLEQRRPYMKEAYQYIMKAYGQERAKQLFITNPQTLLTNQYI